MGTEGPLDREAVHHSAPSTPWATSGRSSASAASWRSFLLRASSWILCMSSIDLVHRVGHELVHLLRVVALDKVRGPAAAPYELV